MRWVNILAVRRSPSHLPSVIQVARKASTTYYPTLHLEIARYVAHAMRAGYDDLMALANLSIAAVSLVFCFVAALLVLKGWALRREFRIAQQQQHSSHPDTTERIRLTALNAAPTPTLAIFPAPGADAAAAPRKLHATVADDADAEPVFVLDDEAPGDEDDDEQQRRHTHHARLLESPVSLPVA